jgi:hypothetical protein
VLTEGVVGSRARIGAWLVAEERDQAFVGSDETDNPFQERTRILVPLLTVDVRLTEQLGIQAATTIPDITRTAIVGSFNFKETFSGLGDTSALGWYRLRPIERWNVVLNFGSSLPTGKTEQPRFRPELEAGSLVPMSRLQRGTGTFDPLFGVNADRRISDLTVFASVAARTPLYENDWGLRTGASWEVNGGLARGFWTHRVIGFARVGWLHRQQDAFEGTPVLVGGGDWLYLTPGVAVQVGHGLNLQTEVKLPVYRSLPNRQLDSSAVFQFGVSRAF